MLTINEEVVTRDGLSIALGAILHWSSLHAFKENRGINSIGH